MRLFVPPLDYSGGLSPKGAESPAQDLSKRRQKGTYKHERIQHQPIQRHSGDRPLEAAAALPQAVAADPAVRTCRRGDRADLHRQFHYAAVSCQRHHLRQQREGESAGGLYQCGQPRDLSAARQHLCQYHPQRYRAGKGGKEREARLLGSGDPRHDDDGAGG